MKSNRKEGDFVMQFFDMIAENIPLKVLLICIVLDTIFGILRSIKERKLNSNVGIDGLIRKFGMMISVIFFLAIDYVAKLNFISFVPDEGRQFIGIEFVGISTLFLILYIIYEFISILKNMIKCKLPIPKKLQKFLEDIFKKYTSELDEKGK